MALRFNPFRKNRRRHKRYRSLEKVVFNLTYDVTTKVRYQIVDAGVEKILSKKYEGLSKDISAEGMCFISSQRLEQGDLLRLEVSVGDASKPIYMDGEVRWCGKVKSRKKGSEEFATGVMLFKVNKKSVKDSLHFDEKKQAAWSDVLESVLGKAKNKS